ncbi:MAG TPA: CidA/LrgA family protein [Propionibacterium sp.]|nr:CidA/LrgA family protein [Propionibacterium sp.]
MLGGLAIILACQLLGEVLVRLTGVPVPGPVVGMVLFFGWLLWRRPREDGSTVRAAGTLVHYLPIMFLPSTVGFIVYGPQIASQWVPAVVGSVVSWLLTFLLVGWLAMLLRPGRRGRGASEEAAA